jgi:hypothetical protein
MAAIALGFEENRHHIAPEANLPLAVACSTFTGHLQRLPIPATVSIVFRPPPE